jgi:hypothetical protein
MAIIKHKKKQKQAGGVKLINASKTGFTPVHDMLMSPSARLEHFTSSSLKGFMIKLQVDQDDSEYASQNSRGIGKFTDRETSFILKFVVLTRHPDTDLTPFRGRDKASESQTSFYEEAELQRDIWALSIQGGRKQICPSVANLSMFDNTSSLNLLDDLLTVHQDAATSDVFNYFIAEITGNASYGMGILTMPNIVGSDTFGNYSPRFNPDAYTLAIARIVRLFIDIGVVHLDLHQGNILFFTNKDGDLDCLIIDFGRACNLKKSRCAMLNQKEITDYNKFRQTLYDTRDHYDKAKFMEHVINLLGNLDHSVNQRTFDMPKDRPYQLVWIAYIPEKYKSDVYQNAYGLLGIDSIEPSHGPRYMEALKRDNPVVNGLTTYTSSQPPASVASSVSSYNSSPQSNASSSYPKSSPQYDSIPCNNKGDEGCTISGGSIRRKRKKRARSRKNRKR